MRQERSMREGVTCGWRRRQQQRLDARHRDGTSLGKKGKGKLIKKDSESSESGGACNSSVWGGAFGWGMLLDMMR